MLEHTAVYSAKHNDDTEAKEGETVDDDLGKAGAERGGTDAMTNNVNEGANPPVAVSVEDFKGWLVDAFGLKPYNHHLKAIVSVLEDEQNGVLSRVRIKFAAATVHGIQDSFVTCMSSYLSEALLREGLISNLAAQHDAQWTAWEAEYCKEQGLKAKALPLKACYLFIMKKWLD